MNENDVIFKYYSGVEDINPNSFSHFGWEGQGSFAFDTYASGYKSGADAVYDKFCDEKGNYAELDTLVYPLCFMYRHMTELLVKYLYFKYSLKSDNELKKFLNKNHKLIELWKETVPFLSQLQQRVKTTVDLKAISHYITEISNFDPDSFSMRYPITKKLNANNSEKKLDIPNLHERMEDFYNAVMQFDYEIDDQVRFDVQPEKIQRFEAEYIKAKDKILELINLLKSTNEDNENNEDGIVVELSFTRIDIEKLLQASDFEKKLSIYLDSLSDNQLTIIYVLLYNGRDHFKLPEEPKQKRTDYIKSAIFIMEKFNTLFDNNNINRVDLKYPFLSKQPKCIIDYLNLAIDILN
jgi:hypothetical protein